MSMTNDFIKKQQELARGETAKHCHEAYDGLLQAEIVESTIEYWNARTDTLTQQIITNTGEELMRRVEGEIVQHDKEYDPSGAFSTCLICGDTTSDYCDIPLNHAIDTIKQHITNVTGVEDNQK